MTFPFYFLSFLFLHSWFFLFTYLVCKFLCLGVKNLYFFLIFLLETGNLQISWRTTHENIQKASGCSKSTITLELIYINMTQWVVRYFEHLGYLQQYDDSNCVFLRASVCSSWATGIEWNWSEILAQGKLTMKWSASLLHLTCLQ